MIHIETSFNVKPTKMLSVFGGRGLPAWSILPTGVDIISFFLLFAHLNNLIFQVCSLPPIPGFSVFASSQTSFFLTAVDYRLMYET